jgi:hypothetical protein
MFGKKKLSQEHKHRAQVWANAYALGHEKGSREANQLVREKIIQNLLADAVIITNADLRILERVVKIIEES